MPREEDISGIGLEKQLLLLKVASVHGILWLIVSPRVRHLRVSSPPINYLSITLLDILAATPIPGWDNLLSYKSLYMSW